MGLECQGRYMEIAGQRENLKLLSGEKQRQSHKKNKSGLARKEARFAGKANTPRGTTS